MKTYTTEIHIWSAAGNTPITNREGAFCDLLVNTKIECTSPQDAITKALSIMSVTPHSNKAHYYMPDFPNQNQRTHFFSKA